MLLSLDSCSDLSHIQSKKISNQSKCSRPFSVITIQSQDTKNAHFEGRVVPPALIFGSGKMLRYLSVTEFRFHITTGNRNTQRILM